MARYDERFRGYGKNKIVHLLGLVYDGFTFHVVRKSLASPALSSPLATVSPIRLLIFVVLCSADHFVVSPQHPRSESWEKTFGKDRVSLFSASKRFSSARVLFVDGVSCVDSRAIRPSTSAVQHRRTRGKLIAIAARPYLLLVGNS